MVTGPVFVFSLVIVTAVDASTSVRRSAFSSLRASSSETGFPISMW